MLYLAATHKNMTKKETSSINKITVSQLSFISLGGNRTTRKKFNKKVSFSGSKIYVQAQAFDSLTESLSSGVGRFCHMIKLIKYRVTKRPDRSLGAHIQRRDSMSEPGNEF